MSDKLAQKLRLELSRTKRRIIVAYGTYGRCTRLITGTSLIFGSIVMGLDSLVIASVPYGLIIGAATLVDMLTCIDMPHQIDMTRKEGKREVLNLVYESETWAGSDHELTSGSEN